MLDNSAHGVMSRTSIAWKGRNSLNTCPNEASEEFINIYAKINCQRNGCFIEIEFRR